MILKHILCGRRKTDFIIVKDNLYFDGSSVIKKFIEENEARSTRIHVLLTENVKVSIQESEKIVIHKYFPDPWNLLERREAELTFEQIVKCIMDEKILLGDSILFVIDSLSYLLQFISLNLLCCSLKKLTSFQKEKENSGIQVLGLLHTDVLQEKTKEYKNLLFVATTEITLSAQTNESREISLKLCQSNGKVLEEVYVCSFESTKGLQFQIKKRKQEDKVEDSHEKIVSTTFKLTLEEKEKELRSKVVLPYIKRANTSEKGKIYYEPDTNDDWDDEDPDDDLEI